MTMMYIYKFKGWKLKGSTPHAIFSVCTGTEHGMAITFPAPVEMPLSSVVSVAVDGDQKYIKSNFQEEIIQALEKYERLHEVKESTKKLTP